MVFGGLGNSSIFGKNTPDYHIWNLIFSYMEYHYAFAVDVTVSIFFLNQARLSLNHLRSEWHHRPSAGME